MDKTLALGVVLSLQDKISPALSNVLGKVSKVSQSTGKYQQQLKALNKQNVNITGLEKLNQQLGESGNKIDIEKKRLADLGRELANTANPTQKMGKEFESAQKRLKALLDSHGQLKDKATSARQALRDQGVDTRKLGDEHKRLQNEIDKTTKALDKHNAVLKQAEKIKSVGATLGKAGAVASGIGYGAKAALTPALGAFTDQENAGTQLKVSMMGAGGQVDANFEKINALAEKMGNRLPGTTAELQTMMSTLIQQGASEQAILGGLGVASANLGVVLKKPYKDAAEFAAKLQDATGSTEDQMMGLMDVIQRTFYLGVDSDNMLQGMTKLSPAMDILKQKGLDAAKTFAPLIVMADQAGMQGEAAGNAYRKIFQAAMNADDKVTDVNKALQADGNKINLDFTNGKGEFGGMDKLFAELDKLKGLDTQSRLGAIKGIFGDAAETLQAVSLMIEKGKSGYEEVQAKMAAQASIQERVNAQLGTLSNLWEAVTGTFQNMAAGFVAPIADDLKDLTIWLSGVQEGLSGWMKEHPGIMRVLALTAFGVAGLATVLGVLLVMVSAILAPIGLLWFKIWALKSAFSGIKTVVVTLWRTLSAFAVANPMLAALALLAVAAYMVYTNWDDICSGLKLIWQQISDNASGFLQSITSSFPRAAAAFTLVAMALRAIAMAAWANPIVAIIAVLAGAAYLIWSNWDWLKQNFSQFWSWLGTVFANSWANIVPIIAVFAGAAYLIWRNWDWLKQKFSQFWSWLGTMFANSWASITRGAMAIWQSITSAFAGGWAGLSMWFNGVVSSFADIGTRMVDGLLSGIRGRWEGLKATVAELAASLPGPVRSALGIHSPSRVFAEIGGYVTDGLTLGIGGGAGDTLNEIQRISQLIAQSDISMPGVVQGSVAGPVASVGMPQAGGGQSDGQIIINIYPSPGMDEKLLAMEVQRQLSLANHKSQSDARSKLYDEH